MVLQQSGLPWNCTWVKAKIIANSLLRCALKTEYNIPLVIQDMVSHVIQDMVSHVEDLSSRQC